MVDVRLLYPSDKYEAAVRLAEALAAAGYEVEREALADSRALPRLAAEAGKAKVLLLIWSRELVTAAMASEALVEARRHSNLVEVSVDGIEPVGGGEVSPVVLLCGWRGQPFHPGWQRILADVERRQSGPREPPARSRRKGPPRGAGGTPPGAESRRAPARPAVRAAAAAGALAIATLAAATALDWSTPGAPTVTDAGPATAAAASAPAPGAASRPGAAAPAPAPIEIAALARPSAESPAKPAPAAKPVPSRKLAAGDLGPRKTAATQRSSPKRLAAPSEAGVKRYSRKNSKAMRLFCKRSGRSTPHCRTFARSMRDSRG